MMYYRIQYNEKRRDRFAGAGLGPDKMPLGRATHDMGDLQCFLDAPNVAWQQRGIQLTYSVRLNGRVYDFLCNPFPFGKNHVTVASSQHESQELGTDAERFRRVFADIYELAQRLPTYVIMFNGVGAGASIPGHLHFHAFQQIPGQPPYPLQYAAAQAEELSDKTSYLHIGDDLYPLTAFRLHGTPDAIIPHLVTLAHKWRLLAGAAATENVIALTERGHLSVYYIPRDRFIRARGFPTAVGGLECFGEFIFSSESDKRAIDEQRVNFTYLEQILRSIHPFKARELA